MEVPIRSGGHFGDGGGQCQVDRSRLRHRREIGEDVSKLAGSGNGGNNEEAAIVRRYAGFPLSLRSVRERKQSRASRGCSLAGVSSLGGAGVLHQAVELTTDALAFGRDLFACLLSQHDHKANELGRAEQAVVILPVNNEAII